MPEYYDVFEGGGWVTESPVEKMRRRETKRELEQVFHERPKEENEDQVQDSDE